MAERKNDEDRDAEGNRRPRHNGSEADAEIGNALRSAYQQALSEDVPADLMDLLNRLD